MHEKIRKELESSSLEDTLTRIESLVESTSKPRPIHLGILLALSIAKEMRDGQTPGTETSKLVATWSETHGADIVDEAVLFARHFLLKPQELMEQIAGKLENDRSESEQDDDDDELAERYSAEDEAQLEEHQCSGDHCDDPSKNPAK